MFKSFGNHKQTKKEGEKEQQFTTLIKETSDKDKSNLFATMKLLTDQQERIMRIFRLNQDEYDDFEAGKYVVKYIVCHKTTENKNASTSEPCSEAKSPVIISSYNTSAMCDRPSATHYAIGPLKKLHCAASIIVISLLILCLAIPGFADNIRYTVLSVFEKPVAIRIEAVNYDKYSSDLTGFVLPKDLPKGYTYVSHSRPSGTDMLYVIYSDNNGSFIEYYYYPFGGNASYDNEFTNFEALEFKGGIAYVGHTDEGTTVMYFLRSDAYIQMDFQSNITDVELRRIAENVCPIN